MYKLVPINNFALLEFIIFAIIHFFDIFNPFWHFSILTVHEICVVYSITVYENRLLYHSFMVLNYLPRYKLY